MEGGTRYAMDALLKEVKLSGPAEYDHEGSQDK